MNAEDYEILPHEELEELRKQVEKLKKNPFPDSKENETLLGSMKTLTTSINKLIKILEGAQEDLIEEYSNSNPAKMMQQLSDQNAKIAEGIVAIAKLVQTPQAPSPIPPPAVPAPPANAVPDAPSGVPDMPGAQIELDKEFNKVDLNAQDASVKKEHRKGLLDSFKK